MTTAETPTAGGEDNPLTFASLALPESVSKALEDKGYDCPTPVQHAAFEPARAGKDLVVQARTGTGKTAAFGLPLVSGRIRAEESSVQALILCPTRELALQVKRELEELAKYSDTQVVAVYGGAPMGKQISELQQGAHIVVGTPGRVLDHMSRKTLDASKLRCFVLDECDEMLSMGFLPQINDVWEQLPKGHQTLLFSATLPAVVSRIADTRLKDPEYITLSGDHIGALEIEHYFYLSQGDKTDELLQVVDLEQPESAIVFCNTREACKRVAKRLQDKGLDADWLNADLAQNEREKVMRRTREGKLRFLVCTDVAARGIDISHLTHVMNFDFPDSAEQYVHRTGRTGRAGKTGTAISFVEPSSIGDLYYLRLRYKIQPIERQLPSAKELKGREEADVIALLALKFPSLNLSDSFHSLARRLLTHDQAESVIAGLLKEHLGSKDQAKEDVGVARRAGRFSKPSRTDQAKPAEADGEDLSAHKNSANSESRSKRASGRGTNSSRQAASRSTGRRGGPSKDRPSGDERPRRRGRARDDAEEGSHEEDGIRYVVEDASPADVADHSVDAPADAVEASSDSDVSETTDFVSLYVNVGRRDGARTSDLETALTDAGIDGEHRGRISIRQRHSFVEVRPERHEEAISRLTGSSLCGREVQVEVARQRA